MSCRLAGVGLVALALLAVPASAGAGSNAFVGNESLLAGTSLSLKDGGHAEILERVTLRGRIPIAGPNQWVTLTVRREGRVIRHRSLLTDPATGRFRMGMRLTGCCQYVAQAVHGTDVSESVPFAVSAPPTLEPGRQTLYFNSLLRRAGYHMGDVTDRVDESTGLAVLAMRKVNDMERTETYDPRLYELLLKRKGGFEPVHRDDDRHVEVDLSRQVMALVDHGRATDVFHVSTGAFGTPAGEFSFYSRGPGYNAKGMYYSVYYSGNYATHGYYSVPTYPASHGCVRNPEVYSIFIYDWIELGDKMYVYE
jgi:L,D-transpeptidase catalytic domain